MEKLGFCGRSCQHFETTLKLSLSLIWLEMLIVCVLETLFISLYLKLGWVGYTTLFLDHFYLKTESRGDQYYDKEHKALIFIVFPIFFSMALPFLLPVAIMGLIYGIQSLSTLEAHVLNLTGLEENIDAEDDIPVVVATYLILALPLPFLLWTLITCLYSLFDKICLRGANRERQILLQNNQQQFIETYV